MSRQWDATDAETGQKVAGYALGALEALAAGEVAGASIEAELWANRQIDTMVDLGWIEVKP